jgi:hypothetical protein
VTPETASPAVIPDKYSGETQAFSATVNLTKGADATGAWITVVNPRYLDTITTGSSAAGVFSFAAPTAVTNATELKAIYGRVRCTGCTIEVTGSASLTTAQGAWVTAIVPSGEALPTSISACAALDGATQDQAAKSFDDRFKCVYVPQTKEQCTDYVDSDAAFVYSTIAAGNDDTIMLVAATGLVASESCQVCIRATYEGIPDSSSRKSVGAKKHDVDVRGDVADTHLRKSMLRNGRKSVIDPHNHSLAAKVCRDVGLKPPTSIKSDVSDLGKVGKFAAKYGPLAAMLL